MRIGIVTADITPPVGAELSGGPFGPSHVVLHPLRAKVLALDDGRTKLVLASCDLLGFDWDHALAVREEIADELGIDVAAVMLAGTHTHGGPATVTLRNWGRPDERYRARLRRVLVGAARQAAATAQPARIGATTAHLPGVAVNRSLGPAGPVDDRLVVLRIDDAGGEPLAVVVNFAAHPVNLHSLGAVTSDYPHFIERDVRRGLAGAVPVLFLLGASGDLNPANFRHGETSPAKGAETGGRIAEAVLRLLPGIETRGDVRLAYAAHEVEMPLQPLPGADELKRFIATHQAEADSQADRSPRSGEYLRHKTRAEWAREALGVVEAGRARTATPIPLQAFGIGDIAFVGVPGEPFSELGLSMAAVGGDGAVTFVVSLANGCMGYFPSRAAFEKQTYEAAGCPRIIGTYFFDPSCLDVLREGCERVLGDLARGE
jgi:hypothetical protein